MTSRIRRRTTGVYCVGFNYFVVNRNTRNNENFLLGSKRTSETKIEGAHIFDFGWCALAWYGFKAHFNETALWSNDRKQPKIWVTDMHKVRFTRPTLLLRDFRFKFRPTDNLSSHFKWMLFNLNCGISHSWCLLPVSLSLSHSLFEITKRSNCASS